MIGPHTPRLRPQDVELMHSSGSTSRPIPGSPARITTTSLLWLSKNCSVSSAPISEPQLLQKLLDEMNRDGDGSPRPN